jgi:xylulokinase
LKYFLGIDLGSSSVKVALLDAETGKAKASAFSPASEMKIMAPEPGFAEQEPELWWQELLRAVGMLHQREPFKKEDILAIGISYQMHGLVCVDKDNHPVRPAIIWCDGRAVGTGDAAFEAMGKEFCLEHYLNSPGNFTASKLRWVMQNEPGIFARTRRILLPGDFIALKLTGEGVTTRSGLSEGIFWDFQEEGISKSLMDYYQLPSDILAPIVPTFGEQGRVSEEAAGLLGIKAGTPVCYRAGDQPNNAFSLQVMEPGEIAATAGTSGVLYGISNKNSFDLKSRVNPFLHVNHQPKSPRLGILMCLNGTGILNSWLRREVFPDESYETLNDGVALIPAGAEGVSCYPFGNGAERILENKNPGCRILGMDFNRHNKYHLARAAQEGIVFSLFYGAGIMEEMGMHLRTVRAGHANMFLSPVFAETFAHLSGCPIELYNTDGALGAARAAGYGSGFYPQFRDCFRGMELVRRIEPESGKGRAIQDYYASWKKGLEQIIS